MNIVNIRYIKLSTQTLKKINSEQEIAVPTSVLYDEFNNTLYTRLSTNKS